MEERPNRSSGSYLLYIWLEIKLILMLFLLVEAIWEAEVSFQLFSLSFSTLVLISSPTSEPSYDF